MTKVRLDLTGSDPEAALRVGVEDPTYDELVVQLRERDWPLFPNGNALRTFCPICEGDGSNSPSLTLAKGRNGRALLFCFKQDGCGLGEGVPRDSGDIARAFEAFRSCEVPHAAGRLYQTRHKSTSPLADGAVEVARYEYPNGRVKVRYQWPDNGWDKDFRWPRGKGGAMMYRPPTRDEIDRHITCLVEGEKDVDRIRDGLGFIATTPSEGKLSKLLAREHLKGAEVAVFRDYDVHGRRAQVAALEALDGIAAVAYPIRLPGLREVERGGEDVSDWLDRHGGTRAKLRAILNAASERSAR